MELNPDGVVFNSNIEKLIRDIRHAAHLAEYLLSVAEANEAYDCIRTASKGEVGYRDARTAVKDSNNAQALTSVSRTLNLAADIARHQVSQYKGDELKSEVLI